MTRAAWRNSISTACASARKIAMTPKISTTAGAGGRADLRRHRDLPGAGAGGADAVPPGRSSHPGRDAAAGRGRVGRADDPDLGPEGHRVDARADLLQA